MKYRELKARIVLDTMERYTVKYGRQVVLQSKQSDLIHHMSTLGDLQVAVTYLYGRCQCEIWDKSTGNKVFNAIGYPLEVSRCDMGGWFDTIMQYVSGNAESNADYLAGLHLV